MLRHVGEERNDGIDIELAAVMSAVAGGLNAVGFQIAGLFSANMTGNASALSDYVAHGHWAIAMAFAVLVVTFISGALVAALLIYWGEAKRIKAVYAGVIILEALLLLSLWIGIVGRFGLEEDAGLITALSFIMGVQNSTTTLISKARVRTTHVSGIATDIGIELAALFWGSAARRLAVPKLLLHFMTLMSFVLGGVVGTILYAWVGSWLFAIAALILLTASLPEAVRAIKSE